MSKFIDALGTAWQSPPVRMGFGPAAGSQIAAPQIVLVGRVLPKDLEKDPGLADIKADALLVCLGPSKNPLPNKAAQKLKKRLWGGRLAKFSTTQVKKLMERGCDFIVFESMETEAAVLNEEDLGTIVTLNHDLGEEVTRSICELPVDAVLFSPAQRILPLTVEGLAKIQLVRGLTDKPFIVEAPTGLGQGDLEAIRNLGITGLIVDVPPKSKFAEVGKAIDELPRRKTGPVQRDALLPHTAAGHGEDVPFPGDEDDEDDEF